MFLKQYVVHAAGVAMLVFCTSSYAGPGWASGRVVTEDGKPVPNAGVAVIGQNTATGIQVEQHTSTKANGSYRMKVPNGLYQAGVAAISVDYNGQRYSFGIHQEDQAQYDSRAEEVRMDFVWRASGSKNFGDPNNWNGYHGFSGRVYFGAGKQYDRAFLRAMDRFELTFTPDGPLINGRDGKRITITSSRSARPESYFAWDMFFDVPVGRYQVEANIIMRNGSRVPANVQLDGEDPKRSVTVQPLPRPGLGSTFSFDPINFHLAPDEGALPNSQPAVCCFDENGNYIQGAGKDSNGVDRPGPGTYNQGNSQGTQAGTYSQGGSSQSPQSGTYSQGGAAPSGATYHQ